MAIDRYELIVSRSDGAKSKYYLANLKCVKSLLNCIYYGFVEEIFLRKKEKFFYRFISSYSIHSGSCGCSYRINKCRNGFTLKKLN